MFISQKQAKFPPTRVHVLHFPETSESVQNALRVSVSGAMIKCYL